MGQVITIIGAKKTGKTTLCLEFCRRVKSESKFIFDINGHYGEFDGAVKNMNITDFAKACENKTNCLIIFEEATIFFSRGKAAVNQILDLLVRCRHSNNTIVFVFHSHQSYPIEMFTQTDYFFFKKTHDKLATIQAKYRGNEYILEKIDQLDAMPERWATVKFENML